MSPRFVIDTDVVFEELTQTGGACGLIIDAWRAGLFRACISNALAYEYDDVLSRKLSGHRWNEIKLLLTELLGNRAEFVNVWFSWRPVSPDPGDDHVIDCAMNARVPVVTSNIRDFRQAVKFLGLQVMPPVKFLKYLADWED